MATAPPQIFSPVRRDAVRRRMASSQGRGDAPRYLHEDIAEDLAERLGFLRHAPGNALLLGDVANTIANALAGLGAAIRTADPTPGLAPLAFPLDQPWPVGGFDLIVGALAFDRVNDLPGALVHARAALAPGGLLMVTMLGAGSLPALREIMTAADGERPAPRLHPQVDVRAGAQLLQRAGLADPVADSRTLAVRFSSFARLLADLRAQGLSATLVRGGPPLGRAARSRALVRFAELAGAEGGAVERFELLTLTGWRRAA